MVHDNSFVVFFTIIDDDDEPQLQIGGAISALTSRQHIQSCKTMQAGPAPTPGLCPVHLALLGSSLSFFFFLLLLYINSSTKSLATFFPIRAFVSMVEMKLSIPLVYHSPAASFISSNVMRGYS